MTRSTADLAKELRQLINEGNLAAIQAVIEPLTEQALIDAIAAEFSPGDPVLEAAEQQQEEIVVYLVKQGFTYTKTYTCPERQCDPWCRGTHGSGKCPGTYSAVSVARQRGMLEAMKLMQEEESSGPVSMEQPSVKVEDMPATQASRAKLHITQLGHNYMDKKGNLLIHKAASTSAAMVHVCANCMLPINSQNFEGDTALHVAVRRNSEDVITALLMNGADLSIRNKLGQSAMDTASGRARDLLALYRPGLPTAIQKGDPAALQRLIQLWCNPTSIIKDQYSALDISVARRDNDNTSAACYRLLQTHRNTLAVVHCVLSEDTDQLKRILATEKGWNVNVRYQDVKGATPVSCAIQQRHLPMIASLLDTGKCMLNVRVREHFSSQNTIPLLFLALDGDDPSDIWHLLHQHVDPRQAREKDKDGNTALLRAISCGHSASFIQKMVQDGGMHGALGLADRNSAGLHAREFAISLDRRDVVALIDQAVMERVGDLFLLHLPVNFYGAEHMDICNERGERLRDVVHQPEDVVAVATYQAVEDRALEVFDAAAKGNLDMVKKLNTAMFRDKNGFTALTRAVVYKQVEVVEALVTSQPMLKSTPDNNNRYPLHYAYALADGQSIINILMARHPDQLEHNVDKDGKEAAEYKSLRDTPEVRDMLRAAITADAYGQKAEMED